MKYLNTNYQLLYCFDGLIESEGKILTKKIISSPKEHRDNSNITPSSYLKYLAFYPQIKEIQALMVIILFYFILLVG